MRATLFIIGMLMFIGSAHAQRVISDFAAATSIARTDKLLLQQGGRTTPYTYGTPAQIFGALNAGDITSALTFSPLSSTGGNSLPTSCSGKPTGTIWNNGNVLSVCP